MVSRLRILLAEDNEVNQHLMMQILAHNGYEATLARNGIQVLNKMDRQDYDVILMDIQMPEMDGITATKLIRAHYAPEKQPKIFALTAETSMEGKQKYLAAGMDDLITKPVKIKELMAILEKIADKPFPSEEEETSATKSSSLTDFLILDPTVIDEFLKVMGDEGHEAAVHLVDLYKKNAPELIEKIREAAKQKNLTDLLRLVHTLKGSSGQIGASRLQQLCLRLEVLLKQSGVEPFLAFVSGIQQEYEILVNELDLFKASLK